MHGRLQSIPASKKSTSCASGSDAKHTLEPNLTNTIIAVKCSSALLNVSQHGSHGRRKDVFQGRVQMWIFPRVAKIIFSYGPPTRNYKNNFFQLKFIRKLSNFKIQGGKGLSHPLSTSMMADLSVQTTRRTNFTDEFRFLPAERWKNWTKVIHSFSYPLFLWGRLRGQQP